MFQLKNMYLEQARFDEAEGVLLQHIQLLSEECGKLDMSILSLRWSLSSLWLQQEKIDECKGLSLEIMALMSKTLGNEHDEYLWRAARIKEFFGINPDGTEIVEVESLAEEPRVTELGSCDDEYT